MDENTIKTKLEFYSGKPIELHIIKKKKNEWSPEWMNCFILNEKSPGVYEIKERKFGITYLFVGEIYSVEEVRREDDTKSAI